MGNCSPLLLLSKYYAITSAQQQQHLRVLMEFAGETHPLIGSPSWQCCAPWLAFFCDRLFSNKTRKLLVLGLFHTFFFVVVFAPSTLCALVWVCAWAPVTACEGNIALRFTLLSGDTCCYHSWGFSDDFNSIIMYFFRRKENSDSRVESVLVWAWRGRRRNTTSKSPKNWYLPAI